ncbi:MAG: hypothetical protein ACKOBU_08020 [Gammaproteobacteria bacterium]
MTGRRSPSGDSYRICDPTIRAERRLELPRWKLRLEATLQKVGIALQSGIGVEVIPLSG